MTNQEAVNWIINISADIGKMQHQELWHYEQALAEIKELLETPQRQKTGHWIYKNGAMVSPWYSSYECSECGCLSGCFKFCPECGSRNRGEEE